MCFQRDCLSHETVEWRQVSTMNILLAGARPQLTLEQVPENVTEISINQLVEGTNRKKERCDKGTNRNKYLENHTYTHFLLLLDDLTCI